MTTDPIRAALERLVSAYYNQCEGEYEELWPEFLDEPFAAARAALDDAPVDPSQLQLSDGYHTFDQLYQHRHSLMLALMRAVPNLCWFSQRHSDGELPFGSSDWFIAGVDLPTGPITYHLPVSLLPLAQQTGAHELAIGRPWDGHTAEDVIERLRAWAAAPPDGPAVPEGREPAAVTGEPSAATAADLPPDYIDTWITDPRDRSLLEVFHRACISEGGSADEVILRGLKAVLAAQAPQPVAVSDAAVFALTESLGMIAMQFAVKSMRARPDEALRHMRSEARQVIMEWVNALPLPTTTPAPAAGEAGGLKTLLVVGGGCGGGLRLSPDQCSRLSHLLEQLSATLPAPATEEVGELVAWLRETGDTIKPSHLAEHQRYKRAAALDALADQVVPEEKISQLMPGAPQAYALQRRVTRRQLLAIAAELRGQEGTDG